MTRIAMVTSAVSRSGAGVAVAVEGLSGSLRQRGHDVRVFALADREWAKDTSNWHGAPVTASLVVGPAQIGYSPEMLRQIMAFEPDLAHLHGLWMHPARSVTKWARRTGRRYIVSPHGMLAPAALAFSPMKKRVARMLYQDRSFRNAAAFHATSTQEEEQVRAFGLRQPVELFPNGVDPRDPPAGVAKQKIVLSLGRLHPVKGLDILIAGWAAIERKHPEWRLRIVGPEAQGYAAHLRELAEDYGLERVEISGPVYREQKLRLLAEASVFVLPSLSENFGLTVVESLQMATPVIASSGTPWADLIDRGCGNWVPGDASSFSGAISKILSKSEEERQAMGEAGRAWVRQTFTWPSVARQAEATYARLLDRT